MDKSSYYAVRVGRKPGIYRTWNECSEQVHGFFGAIYKKFPNESQAIGFINISTSTLNISTSIPVNVPTNPILKICNIQNSSQFPLQNSIQNYIPQNLQNYIPQNSTQNYIPQNSTQNYIPQNPQNYISQNSTSQFPLPQNSTSQFPLPQNSTSQFPLPQNSIPSNNNELIMYTDGSCVNGESGWAFLYVSNKLEECCGSIHWIPSTNNEAELYAIYYGILDYLNKYANNHSLLIRTDSMYSINCVTKWVKKWQRNGWRTNDGNQVENRKVIEEISNMINSNRRIRFEHVRAHNGEIWNERADVLASQGRTMKVVKIKKF